MICLARTGQGSGTIVRRVLPTADPVLCSTSCAPPGGPPPRHPTNKLSQPLATWPFLARTYFTEPAVNEDEWDVPFVDRGTRVYMSTIHQDNNCRSSKRPTEKERDSPSLALTGMECCRSRIAIPQPFDKKRSE